MATSISVLTYNVKLLPALVKLGVPPKGRPVGFYERGKRALSDSDRVKRLIRALLKGDWDIICLQEVYQEGARKRFKNAFEKAGYEVVARSGDGDLFHEDSGLFLATKLPIVWHRFEEFAANSGSDAWSDKGVLCACLDASKLWGTRPHQLYFFGVHHQSSEVHWPARQLQLLQVQRFMRSCIGTPKANRAAVVLAGDFNVVGEDHVLGGRGLAPTSPYRAMLELLDYPRDLYRELHPEEAGYTRDPVVNRTMTRDVERRQVRIDYVFAFDAVPEKNMDSVGTRLRHLRCTQADVVAFESADSDGTMRHLSDHFGVDATLEP